MQVTFRKVILDLEWDIDNDMCLLVGISHEGTDITDLLSEKVREDIEETYSYDAYQDWCEGAADAIYESWKDRETDDAR